MPYVTQRNRNEMDLSIDNLITDITELGISGQSGNINYVFTRILKHFYGDASIISYDKLNTAMGILSCCSHEFERQYIAPYEDIKKQENGMV